MLYNEMMYDLNDVMITPRAIHIKTNKIKSRLDVNLKQEFFDIEFGLPIISSPMSTVTEFDMVQGMYRNGGLGIIHRLMDREKIVNYLNNNDIDFYFGFAVGLNRTELDNQIISHPKCILVCIDVANGYLDSLIDSINLFKKDFPNKRLMSGNVVTVGGYQKLADAGVEFVRCGIGVGSACDTPAQTSINYGYASMLAEIRDFKERGSYESVIIADGGMKTYGDISKSIALGADLTMLGSMLSTLIESAGDWYCLDEDSNIKPLGKYIKSIQFLEEYQSKVFKQYYGMSSETANKQFGKKRTSEGISTMVEVQKKDVAMFMNELRIAMGSTLSYLGIQDIKDLYKHSKVKLVTPAVYYRAMPHVNK